MNGSGSALAVAASPRTSSATATLTRTSIIIRGDRIVGLKLGTSGVGTVAAGGVVVAAFGHIHALTIPP